MSEDGSAVIKAEVSTALDTPITFTEKQMEVAKTKATQSMKLSYFGDMLQEQMGVDPRLPPQSVPDIKIEGGIPVAKLEEAYKKLYGEGFSSEMKEQFDLALKNHSVAPGAIPFYTANELIQTGANLLKTPEEEAELERGHKEWLQRNPDVAERLAVIEKNKQQSLPPSKNSIWQRIRGK